MRAFVLLPLLAAPALAQEPRQEVRADLDKDGVAETYTLREDASGEVALVMREGEEVRVVPDAASSGAVAGSRPFLDISQGGSVLLTSMNEAIGRDRWRMTLTIAHREGDWRIAGYTYDFHDTLDPTAWGHCDLNLLSGRGLAEMESGSQEVEAPDAPLLWDWRAAELPLPLGSICFDGLEGAG